MIEGFTFDDVLLLPATSSRVYSRSEANPCTRLFGHMVSVPVMSASMSVFDFYKGKYDPSWGDRMDDLAMFHITSRAVPLEDRLTSRAFAVSWEEFQKLDRSRIEPDQVVSIDIANGAILPEDLPEEEFHVIAGNYGNPSLTRTFSRKLWYKFGIGGGSACSTRLATGIGAPQGWLIKSAREHSPDMNIISDGGINHVGDIAKALALGANAVMAGKLFAAAEETPALPEKINGKWYKPYRGMASAAEKGSDNYIEGVSGYVPYEGRSLSDIHKSIMEGLASAMAYVGAFELAEFHPNIIRNSPRESGVRIDEYSPF